jgi:NhaP-type Na+/H+ or K+/H+ antiporter
VAIIGYYIGDLVGASGVAALIVSAVVYKNYAWYNMSKAAKASSSEMFSMLKFFGEAIIFCTISVGFFNSEYSSWSFGFTLGQFLIITFSRIIGVYIVNYSFACCYPRTFSFKEITFINYSGLVRGAVCYGLSLLVQEEGVWAFTSSGNSDIDAAATSIKNSVVHNTVILNVVLTTLIYGSFMNLVRQCLLGREHEEKEEKQESGFYVPTAEGLLSDEQEHEFKQKRCLWFKKCAESINEFFRKCLIRDYETKEAGEKNLLDHHDKESE